MKKYIIQIALAVMILFSACSDKFLGDNINPNVASEGTVSLLLPAAQASMTNNLIGLHDAGTIYSRQLYGLFESTYAINSSTYQTEWNNLYAQSLKDLEQIILQSTESGSFYYTGIAKVLKSFMFVQLVDFYGDVPYSDALQGETIISPAFEDDAAIYDKLLLLLDEAILNLTDTSVTVGVDGDLFYQGDTDAWIKVANTIKLKMYVNLLRVDDATATTGINALIADDNMISAVDGSDDFQFVFGESLNPRNRHPRYTSNYDQSPVYVDNYLMLQLIQRADPRLRYYVYRQSRYSELDFDTTPCSSRTDCDSWNQLFALDLNYLGRDHGDPSGIPGDNDLRSAVGLYPYGGKYDDSSYRTLNANSSNPASTGADGEGLMPFLTSASTNFMLSEAVLMSQAGIAGGLTAREYFDLALTQGLDKVRDFAESSAESGNIEDVSTWDAQSANYMAARLAEFDAAGTAETQLDVVITEKHYAQFGNGMESYTDLRRTGYPSGLPASLAPQGAFPVRLPYPESELSTNSNAPSPPPRVDEPIFWDVN